MSLRRVVNQGKSAKEDQVWRLVAAAVEAQKMGDVEDERVATQGWKRYATVTCDLKIIRGVRGQT